MQKNSYLWRCAVCVIVVALPCALLPRMKLLPANAAAAPRGASDFNALQLPEEGASSEPAEENQALLEAVNAAEEARADAADARSELQELSSEMVDIKKEIAALKTELRTLRGGQAEASIHDGVIPGLGKANFPEIDGSTACQPLIAALYAAACGVDKEAAEAAIAVSGTNAAWNQMNPYSEDSANKLIIAYEPQGGVPKAGVQSSPLGRDGLVFLTGKSNPVGSLTAEQLKDIYAGRTVDWSKVGGEAGPITAYQRNPESGSHVMLLKCLMGEETLTEPPSEELIAEMAGLINVVSEFEGGGDAIGYSVYYYADQMYAAPGIKMLAVDGVAPTTDSIADGTYPLTNDFHMALLDKAPEGCSARLLYDWLLTPEGAALLEENGYVPVAKSAASARKIEVPEEVAARAAEAEPIEGPHSEWLYQINRASDTYTISGYENEGKHDTWSGASGKTYSTIVDHEGNIIFEGENFNRIYNESATDVIAISQKNLKGEITRSRLYSVTGKLLRDWEAVDYTGGPLHFLMAVEWDEGARKDFYRLVDPSTGKRANDFKLYRYGYYWPDRYDYIYTDDGGFVAMSFPSDGEDAGPVVKFDANGKPVPFKEGEASDKSVLEHGMDDPMSPLDYYKQYTNSDESADSESIAYEAILSKWAENTGVTVYFDSNSMPRYFTSGQGTVDIYGMDGKLRIANVVVEEYAPDRLVAVKDDYHGLMDLDGNWLYKESVYSVLMD